MARAQRWDAQVVVIGAGPVGLTLAGRLAQHGAEVILLEEQPTHAAIGSRALCMQRETLEIWARLGIGDAVAERGVQWTLGRTYFRGRELFQIRLPGRQADHFPPFVNISQTEVEEVLLARLRELQGVELRLGHRFTSVSQDDDGVSIRCETADGPVELRSRYLVGTDGAHSTVRHALGLEFRGRSQDDLFLIADVRASLPFPAERRFFFDPPWNRGRQVLVHPQPDDVWRIDWQVPASTDLEAERVSGRLDRRIRQVIGPKTEYELVWVTAYRFSQRLVDAFRSRRVFLAGDAAHLMSPFGARGLNSGVADAENLAWKLALVVAGSAPESLLDSYDSERRPAAVENLAITNGTMRFMVPHGPVRRLLRNAILRGSLRLPWLRRFVNSGRLAQPFAYQASPIIDRKGTDARLPAPGTVAPDARCAVLGSNGARASRLRDLVGQGFVALLADGRPGRAASAAAIRAAAIAWPVPSRVVAMGPRAPLSGVTVLDDRHGELRAAYALSGPRAWLIRPDGYLAGSVALTSAEAVDSLPALQARAIGAAQWGADPHPRLRPRAVARRVLAVAGGRARGRRGP
jgi:2-polyprenyl-6-methoxyphenol hydroxylase-like FAD-dependent oxidoreductase